jgi:hypothetical protein
MHMVGRCANHGENRGCFPLFSAKSNEINHIDFPYQRSLERWYNGRIFFEALRVADGQFKRRDIL